MDNMKTFLSVFFIIFFTGLISITDDSFGQDDSSPQVIYKEQTSYSEAKRRAKVMEEIAADQDRAYPDAELAGVSRADGVNSKLVSKLMELLENFLDLKNMGDKYSQQEDENKQEIGSFKQWDDRHEWKGLRKDN